MGVEDVGRCENQLRKLGLKQTPYVREIIALKLLKLVAGQFLVEGKQQLVLVTETAGGACGRSNPLETLPEGNFARKCQRTRGLGAVPALQVHSCCIDSRKLPHQ